MPPKKTVNTKRVSEESSSHLPMMPEEYLALDNMPAAQNMPKDLVSAASSRRVTIRAEDQRFEPKLVKSRDVKGAWEVDLPKASALGLPGRTCARVSASAIQQGIKAEAKSEPFRPAWVDFTPHPKCSTASRTLLRRLDGRLIKPHYGVFGADDRQVYYPSGYPWTCIGRVFTWTDMSNPNWAWSGSGVLVGGRLVLTAGHVVPWGASNWGMLFVPAYYDGASTLGAGVSSWISDCHGYNTGGHVSAWDMAVCRLYSPLGDSYGWFGSKTYSGSWEGGNYWTLAGYPGAIAGANRPSRQMWFPTIDDDTDGSATEVEYLADQTDGDSGGPVFGFWSGAPYVIGTASGGEKSTFLWWTTEDNNVAAGGAAMVNLIKWGLSNWP